MKNKNASVGNFPAWLEKKGLSYEDFARSALPPLRYSTVVKWAHGAKPRKFTCDSLKGQFPDCPLFR